MYFLWHFVLLFLGHKYPVVYINCVIYVLKKRKNPKFKFTNERLAYFMKFTIQHVVYVIKQSMSTKMLTNERLFTIQPFIIGKFYCSSQKVCYATAFWGSSKLLLKVQWVVLETLQVKSGSGSCNEIWILRWILAKIQMLTTSIQIVTILLKKRLDLT